MNRPMHFKYRAGSAVISFLIQRSIFPLGDQLMSILLTGHDLTFPQLYSVAFHHEKVSLSPEAVVRMTPASHR